MERVVTGKGKRMTRGRVVHDDCNDSSNNHLSDLYILYSIKSRSFLIFDPRKSRFPPPFFIFSSRENGTQNGTRSPAFFSFSLFVLFLEIEVTREVNSGKWMKSYLLPRFARTLFIPSVDLVGGVDHTACNVTHEEASRIIILP